MQATRAVLGGDRKFNYPKYVWTPAGGWWHHPVNGPRNTRIAALAIVAVAIPIMMVSASKERRPIPPRNRVISQFFAKHAAEDDPSMR